MKFTGERFIPEGNLLTDEIAYEHLHRYHALGSILKDKRVLDIACGEGYGSAIIAKYANTVAGVDIDEECIKYASEKYAVDNDNLKFVAGSARAIPFADNSFDAVVTLETIEHILVSEHEVFLNEIKRVLHSDGILIISTPNKKNYSERYGHKNAFHVHEFEGNEFADFIKNHFANVLVFNQGYEIVSIIDSEEISRMEKIRLCNWAGANNYAAGERKYMIAIASNAPIPSHFNEIASLVTRVDKDFLSLMDSVTSMSKEIEKLGVWGRGLSVEIGAAKTKIAEQEKIISERGKGEVNLELREANIKLYGEREELGNQLAHVNSELEHLQRKMDGLHEVIGEANLKVANQQETISLLETNRKSSGDQINMLNCHQERLKKELKEKNVMVHEYVLRISKLEELLNEKCRQIEEARNITRQQSDTIRGFGEKKVELEEKIENFRKEISDKESMLDGFKKKQLQLLQEMEATKMTLLEIYDSQGWWLLSRYYKVKGFLLPMHTRRYKMLKLAYGRVTNGLKSFFAGARKKPAVAQIAGGIPLVEETSATVPLKLDFYESPDVSIIIPAYNAWTMNYECIKSILENTHGVSYEVILADDCSSDETKKCTEIIKNIKHIRCSKNLGFLRNCNNAAKEGKGKYLLFLNNDTRVKLNWLSPLVSLIESDPGIGMVGSKLVYPDGRLQEAGGIIWNDASGWNYGHGSDPMLPQFNYVKEVDYISGACIMVKKDAWIKAGGFDERFSPAYCEDSDLAFSLRRLGYKVMYQPLSEVVHYEGYSHGNDSELADKPKSIKGFQLTNNGKFFQKWASVLNQEHFPNAVNVYQARDRTREKKTMLVIDHYVPQFDKDAGSKTVFAYLELFAQLGLNIKFLGDNFYQHEPYTTVLQQKGIEVFYGVWYRDNWRSWVLENREQIDYVFINRPHISIKYIDFIRENTAAKILYYGHDLHFVREKRQFELTGDPNLRESIQKWEATENYLFQKANVVLTPSEAEAKIVRDLNPAYKVEPILPFFFKEKARAVVDFSSRNGILFVGGFAHVPNVDAVKWFCAEIWPIVRNQMAGVRFLVAGSNPPDSVRQLHGSGVEILGFVTEEELKSLYGKVKLVIIPLRYGAGVKGKTVEAMYHGVPVVSTTSGMEGIPGEFSRTVKAHDDAESFANGIIGLYKDEDALRDMSLREVDDINRYFTQDSAKEKIKKLLDN